jgi:hypothetical protein
VLLEKFDRTKVFNNKFDRNLYAYTVMIEYTR